MRQFLLGVLTTVVAGVLLFLAQSFIAERHDAHKAKLEYSEFAPPFYFSASEAADWQKKLPEIDPKLFSEPRRLSAVAITIENTGKVPIQNQRVIIKPKYEDAMFGGIVYAQNDVIPGTDDAGVRMVVQNGRLTVDYNLLDTQEMHRFWVVKDRYADLSFVVRKPGMEVTGWNAKIFRKADPTDWTVEILFGSAVLILIAFIFGAIVVSRHSKRVAGAHGLDPEKFYPDGEKLLKEKKAEVKSDA